ncbi:liver carboxylesterase 1-like [Lineus longissimus]|uniref:liver carboxylesterase 1-like n=1 Tax=Lineus longissimus TaxID=88925 RepID=UPI002B4F7860
MEKTPQHTLLVSALCLMMLLFGQAESDNGPQVQTQSGRVRGMTDEVHFLGKDYNVSFYVGIPFAEAPVGALRFRKPLPKTNWSGVLNATEFGPSCMQAMTKTRLEKLPNANVSEDCLSLNVYAPSGSSAVTAKRKAVMVWFHGGGFHTGQAMEYEGRYLAAFGDVIVVTSNYRLNLFGFLKLGGNESYNNGLWDQNLALRWVQANIAAFGGDPSRVTIFGGSTGGFMVTCHAVSPASRGLFHRVISESGTLLTAKMMIHDPTETALAIGKDLGCPAGLGTLEVCLRSKTSLELLAANEKLFDSKITMKYYYAPIVDDEMFPVNMYEYFGYLRPKNPALTSKIDLYKNLGEIDYMAGFNSQEGSNLLSMLKGLEKSLRFDLSDGVNEKAVEFMLKQYAEDYFPHNAVDVKTAMVASYFGGTLKGKSNTDLASRLLDVHADIVFNAGTIALLNAHAKTGNRSRYLYTFSHEYKPRMEGRPTWFHGAGHTDERLFPFGHRLVTWPLVNLTVEENKIAATMMTYWSNFAKTGNPNDQGNLYLPTWNQYSPNKPRYQQFGSPRGLYKERMTFWLDEVVGPAAVSKAAVLSASQMVTICCLSLALIY